MTRVILTIMMCCGVILTVLGDGGVGGDRVRLREELHGVGQLTTTAVEERGLAMLGLIPSTTANWKTVASQVHLWIAA